MNDIFITKIEVKQIRHLNEIAIQLSDSSRKHLILTGKNGSGKTSILEVLKNYLQSFYEIDYDVKKRPSFSFSNSSNTEGYAENIDKYRNQIIAPFNEDPTDIIHSGKFIIAYFDAKRAISMNVPNGIMKIESPAKYNLKEKAGENFLQFLVNLKADRSFALEDKDVETIKKIDEWFDLFQKLLIEIFEDEKIDLVFDKSNYNFNIVQQNRNIFDFTKLSDGYSAIFNMISELMMRMEKYKSKIYDLQGIVLIDEIETHLHIDLQKKIMPFLTKIFPNIQFIVTTHSPFVLSSDDNTIIYDLEKNILVEDMSGYSLDSIVESYYNSDKYSQLVKNRITEYEALFKQDSLTEEEEERLIELKIYFKDIPKFLSPELSVKLQQIHSTKTVSK